MSRAGGGKPKGGMGDTPAEKPSAILACGSSMLSRKQSGRLRLAMPSR